MAPEEIKERIGRPGVDREVDEEVAFHVEMRVRELIRKGMSPEEARAEALSGFGDLERTKSNLRRLGEGREAAMRRRQWWDDLRQDLVFTVRQLGRTPSFAVAAILTLTLAIAANTAVFSVTEGVLLRPLPYHQPDGLVALWTKYLPPSGFDIAQFPLSGPELLDCRDETKDLSSLSALESAGSVALTGNGQEPEQVPVWKADATLLSTLGVEPALGRWFSAAEDVPDGPDVTVLTHGLWASRYGSDPGIIGRTILMGGTPTLVVGVLPVGFSLENGADVRAFLPLRLTRASEGSRGAHYLAAIGRLAPGESMADLDAELLVIRERWARQYQHNVGHFVWATTLRDDRLGDATGVLALLLTAVGLVLLVACANIANLLLARGERRHAEVAVRAALGAGRGRIVRQLVTESAVLALLAAMLSLPIAMVGTRALIALDPTALPRLGGVHVGARALLFTVVIALGAVLVFGVVPAMLTGRRADASVASSGWHGVGGRRRGALRRALVGVEVAVSLVVVILAGLLLRSFRAMAEADPGFRAHGVVAFDLVLPRSRYPGDDGVPTAYERLLDQVRAVPGVSDVTAGSSLPFTDRMGRWDFQLPDRPPPEEGEQAWNASLAVVMPDYFETLGIPLLQGRGLTGADNADAPLVGVVSESMARTYWPGESALGKQWGYPRGDEPPSWITVVGVVPDQIRAHVGEETIPQVYLPELQAERAIGGVGRSLGVAVRTSVDPLSVVPSVREVVGEFDHDLPLAHVRTMRRVAAGSMARPRLVTTLLGVFALLALVLAVVGVYGVVSYSVAGRTREIGVRVALGARRGDVIRLVMGEGAAPVGLGVLVGLGGAWLATRLVQAMLYGIAPTDRLTFIALPATLLAVGVAASVLPALRAARIAPTEALRDE